MDFQNRAGSKVGSGGVASGSESNRDRRERLRQLAMETIDLNKVGFALCLRVALSEGTCLILHSFFSARTRILCPITLAPTSVNSA